MYVYLDETTFGENDEYSGYGSLISKVRIDESVVAEALIALGNDPDIKKQKFLRFDERTLKRGFFHASDDTQNGHSHFCNIINKHFKGKFSSHFFKTYDAGFSNSDEAYDLASKLSVMEVFTDAQEIVFIFEERNGLTREYVESWWDNLWEDVLKSQYKYPYIRTYFPLLTFDIKSKDEPGLQVVDFILWASSRAVLGKSCPWFTRLTPWFRAEVKPSSKSWGGHALTFGMEEKTNKDAYGIEDYLIDDEELYSANFLPNYIISCQKFLNSVADSEDMLCISHLKSDLEYLKTRSCIKSDAAHIESMAKCFLKLFDNVGVISPEISKEDKAFWLACRKCFSFALNTHETMGRIHSIRLSDFRNAIIDHDPGELL